MSMKTCSKCVRELPLKSFDNCSTTKDGKATVCKECRAYYMKHIYPTFSVRTPPRTKAYMNGGCVVKDYKDYEKIFNINTLLNNPKYSTSQRKADV